MIIKRYIRIRHWDYWYKIYGIGIFDKCSANSLEFSVTNDEEGEDLFFHFDLINLPGLEETIEANEFIEKDDPDFSNFYKKCVDLRNGTIEYFIGALYYKDYYPTISECNRPLMESQTVLDIESPHLKPYYAIVFIQETQSLNPELLLDWVKRISLQLFKDRQTTYQIVEIPTSEQAQVVYDRDAAYYR